MTTIASVRLRPFEKSDAEAFTAAVNSSLNTLQPWMSWAHAHYRTEEATDWIIFTHLQRLTREAEEFAIVDDQDRFLGGAGIRFPRHDGALPSLGYWVRSDSQRKNVARRAVEQLLIFGFSRSGVHTIEVLAAEENHASRAVAACCGGKLVGTYYGLSMLADRPVNTSVYHFYR